jgi:cell division protein FtsI (penicillin-binding protein 3)
MNPFNRTSIHISGQKRSALDMARGRLMLLSLFFILTYLIVAARVFDLTIIQGEMKKDEETVSYLEAEPVAPKSVHRADILDRNGVILARSLKTSSLYADPLVIGKNADQVAKDLVKVFPEMTYGEMLKKLSEKKRFVWIKRNMTPDDQYKILYLGHPGLSFREEERRIYPQGALASHMVGYTGIDSHGLGGLESGLDKFLAQGDEPLVTTLDVRIQHALRREVASAVNKFGGVAGAGVVMDVRSGEILAATSLPDFDPHTVTDKNNKALFNNLTLGIFEPGSTFKIFTTASAIENAGAGMDSMYDAREPIKISRFKISDFHPERRVLSLAEVFMHSSNIGSVRMEQQMGKEAFYNFITDLGLLKKSSIEIPEVGKPSLPDTSDIRMMTVAFGHGISVSPLQIVTAASSIMNGGILIKPTLVLDKAKNKKDENSVRVVSEKTAHRMRQLMRLVVTDGTGSKAEVAGYNVGGKTGTADKNEGGRYEKNKRRSSFMGFFPSENPRYAVYVMVDEPKGIKESYGYATAGWVAAPAVANIIESIVAIQGIKPQENDELGGTLSAYVKTKEQIAKEKQLASFTTH